MIKVITVPISVPVHPMDFEEEIAKRTKRQSELEKDALVQLDEALSDGFYVADSQQIQVNGMTCLRYTLHKFASIIPPYES